MGGHRLICGDCREAETVRAPFPRALVEFFVKAFSDPGDIVFDPFLGSGTTMAAAHVLGRVGYGCEISPAYCDVIVHRWQKLTGKQAVLADGDHKGATFDHVREGRGLAAIDADIEAHLEAHGVPRL
jgi:DNA modification methylase